MTSVSLCGSSYCVDLHSCTGHVISRACEISDTELGKTPTWDCMLAPTCPPWYESPLRDCTLMNKSPEFDMLKEPAEPENTHSQRKREQDNK